MNYYPSTMFAVFLEHSIVSIFSMCPTVQIKLTCNSSTEDYIPRLPKTKKIQGPISLIFYNSMVLITKLKPIYDRQSKVLKDSYLSLDRIEMAEAVKLFVSFIAKCRQRKRP